MMQPYRYSIFREKKSEFPLYNFWSGGNKRVRVELFDSLEPKRDPVLVYLSPVTLPVGEGRAFFQSRANSWMPGRLGPTNNFSPPFSVLLQGFPVSAPADGR